MNKKIIFLVTMLICANSALNAAATADSKNISKPLAGNIFYRCLPKNMYSYLSQNKVINILAKSSHAVGAQIGKLLREILTTRDGKIIAAFALTCLATLCTTNLYDTLCDVYYQVPTPYDSRNLGNKIWLTIGSWAISGASVANVFCTEQLA